MRYIGSVNQNASTGLAFFAFEDLSDGAYALLICRTRGATVNSRERIAHSMRQDPSIVLLHATPVACAPIHEAFARLWPEARLTNLLDDGLTSARGKTKAISEAVSARFVSLAKYAYDCGADAILATCSAFGPAIESADQTLPVPVCKPNTPMFRDALKQGTKIAMIATFAPAMPTMVDEFFEEAAQINPLAKLDTFLVDDAIDKLRAGDIDAHNRLVSQRAASLHGYDAIVLAHFSTAHALETITSMTRIPVFAAPQSAVLALKERLGL